MAKTQMGLRQAALRSRLEPPDTKPKSAQLTLWLIRSTGDCEHKVWGRGDKGELLQALTAFLRHTCLMQS